MAKASDNRFPKVVFTEQSSAPAPDPVLSDGEWMLIVKDDNKFYKVDHNGTETEIGGAPGGSADYILIRDEKTQNTAGQGIASGSWVTRNLTTEVSDTGGHASLASNQITLAAGTYTVRAWTTFYSTLTSQSRLHNVTDDAVLVVGGSVYARTSSTTQHTVQSFLEGKFTLAASKVIELQVQVATTNNTNGGGIPANFTTEVYSSVELLKVA